MKIAYLDCSSGVSGDMLLGALVDAGADLAAIQAGIDSLGLPSCRLEAHEVKKKGFRALKVDVLYEPEHKHRHLHHITGMIDASGLSAQQQTLARRIFTRLAEAEAKVHGTTVEKVHFHEVGAVDSIADIVGSAIGWDLLGIGRLVCSAVPTGGGFIEIAHGRVSVPAPATAELLQGIPLAPSTVQAELTTPTGAAIVATVAESFGPLPAMRIERIGYGAGTRDLEAQANLLRLVVGQTEQTVDVDQVWLLETNLDDVTGEVIGYATTRLMDAGALDVYTTAIQMKKNRPAVMLSVICRADDVSRLEQILFCETGTLGIRRWAADRHTLRRTDCRVETPWGAVAGKLATLPSGAVRFSPEFEDCRRIADERQIPLDDVYQAARDARRAMVGTADPEA
jgi:pyridinium-3,5-bisthiocarboxylic acid mononucleotide nickel chelatase